jgi:nucleoside-diphosphate-sugar epimerase
MKILLLGSEGTLGQSLYNFLVSKDIIVIKWDIKLDNNHDLRNKNCIDEILKEVDYVLFLAFDVGGSKYDVKNKDFIDNNMKIILNTFDSLYSSKKPFIYTTSCMSTMITNPYGSLKNISEHYVALLDNGINVRLWNVYGSEEISNKSHVIPDFIESAFKNKTINMRTQGNDERQFLYCDDLSEAIFFIIINHNTVLKLVNQNSLKSIDISSYNWISIYDVAVAVQNIFKSEYNIDVDIVKGNSYDNHTNKTDPTYSILNTYWSPKFSLDNGIKDMIMKKYK